MDIKAKTADDFLLLLELCKDPRQVFPKDSYECYMAILWLQNLCGYRCYSIKEGKLRNEYMSLLVACLNLVMLSDPFLRHPFPGQLKRLVCTIDKQVPDAVLEQLRFWEHALQLTPKPVTVERDLFHCLPSPNRRFSYQGEMSSQSNCYGRCIRCSQSAPCVQCGQSHAWPTVSSMTFNCDCCGNSACANVQHPYVCTKNFIQVDSSKQDEPLRICIYPDIYDKDEDEANSYAPSPMRPCKCGESRGQSLSSKSKSPGGSTLRYGTTATRQLQSKSGGKRKPQPTVCCCGQIAATAAALRKAGRSANAAGSRSAAVPRYRSLAKNVTTRSVAASSARNASTSRTAGRVITSSRYNPLIPKQNRAENQQRTGGMARPTLKRSISSIEISRNKKGKNCKCCTCCDKKSKVDKSKRIERKAICEPRKSKDICKKCCENETCKYSKQLAAQDSDCECRSRKSVTFDDECHCCDDDDKDKGVPDFLAPPITVKGLYPDDCCSIPIYYDNTTSANCNQSQNACMGKGYPCYSNADCCSRTSCTNTGNNYREENRACYPSVLPGTSSNRLQSGMNQHSEIFGSPIHVSDTITYENILCKGCKDDRCGEPILASDTGFECSESKMNKEDDCATSPVELSEDSNARPNIHRLPSDLLIDLPKSVSLDSIMCRENSKVNLKPTKDHSKSSMQVIRSQTAVEICKVINYLDHLDKSISNESVRKSPTHSEKSFEYSDDTPNCSKSYQNNLRAPADDFDAIPQPISDRPPRFSLSMVALHDDDYTGNSPSIVKQPELPSDNAITKKSTSQSTIRDRAQTYAYSRESPDALKFPDDSPIQLSWNEMTDADRKIFRYLDYMNKTKSNENYLQPKRVRNTSPDMDIEQDDRPTYQHHSLRTNFQCRVQRSALKSNNPSPSRMNTTDYDQDYVSERLRHSSPESRLTSPNFAYLPKSQSHTNSNHTSVHSSPSYDRYTEQQHSRSKSAGRSNTPSEHKKQLHRSPNLVFSPTASGGGGAGSTKQIYYPASLQLPKRIISPPPSAVTSPLNLVSYVNCILDAISYELRGRAEPGDNQFLEYELMRYRKFFMAQGQSACKMNNLRAEATIRSFLLLHLQRDLMNMLYD